MVFKDPKFKIYFGDSTNNISKAEHCIPASAPLISHPSFQEVKTNCALENLAFLNQTHGADGFVVEKHTPAFDDDGDFLITAQKNVGIGIMTADCLPIIFYDHRLHIAAIAHAGWRGTVAGIAQKTVHQMTLLGSRRENVKIFFGPSAKVCCYTVSNDFKNNIPNNLVNSVITIRDNQHYFDLPLFNYLQLQKLGIVKESVNVAYNLCTLCNYQFHSARRQKEAHTDFRQMTVVTLR
jgi:polyphenol oxidase